jgi:hypothetical protein
MNIVGEVQNGTTQSTAGKKLWYVPPPNLQERTSREPAIAVGGAVIKTSRHPPFEGW